MTYATEVAADSPALWWRLGDASGTTAADTSGNARTGTYNGSPILGVTGIVAGGDTAVTFDGVDDWVTRGSVVNSGTISIEAWYRTSASTGTVFSCDTGTNTNFRVQIGASATQVLTRTNGTFRSTNIAATNDGNIHHIVITYQQSTTTSRIYLDGTEVATVTTMGNATANLSTIFVGAISASNTLFTGTIDEFAIYGSTLSGTRVTAHHTAGLTPAATNVTPTFTAANTQTYAAEIVFGELDVTPGFTAANTQTYAPSVAAGAQRNITVTAAVERGRWHAAVTDPDRTAEVQPPRHRAGVTP